MADDRLPSCRSLSIAAMRSDKVVLRPAAISLSAFQNLSSRVTLVLWPAILIDRLTTEDFIVRPSDLGVLMMHDTMLCNQHGTFETHRIVCAARVSIYLPRF